MPQASKNTDARDTSWLKRYYAIRAAFSMIWVITAFALGASPSPLAGVLLVVYPLWDAAANFWDVRRNGGVKVNLTQAFNAVISVLVTVAVGVALAYDSHAIFYVFGAWAFFAGLFQLATGVRRWRGFGAQWPMILSGAQSAVAGTLFITRAIAGMVPSPKDIAPYAAFGAIYFAISAGALAISAIRRRGATARSPAYDEA